MEAGETTANDLLRVAMRGPRENEKIVRVGASEREILDWLDARPRTLDCCRKQLREECGIRKRVVDRMIGKGLIHEGPDIRCTGPESMYPEGDQLWIAMRGVGVLHGIEVGQG